jgi:Glycosyltransferase family 87
VTAYGRPSGIAVRPALLGLAVLSGVVGGFATVRAAQNVWAVDAHRNLAAALALQNGTFGSVPDYLYSPLAAALTVPALALPTDVAVVVWLTLKIALLAVGTAIATRGLSRVDRGLIGVAVIGFLPILYDLELGNVTVIVLVAVAAIAWTPDRIATGIPLGLILATAPKPQLIPVLVWLAVAHRRALVGAVTTATLATLVGLALTGLGTYGIWADALRAPAYLNSGEVINLALWSLPPVVALPCAVAAIAAFFIALRRGYWPGLVAAICLGLLVAPYTLVYGAGLLPVAAPAAVRASPRAALGLAITAPVALVLAFPAWVGMALAFAVLVPAAAWRSSRAASTLLRASGATGVSRQPH